MLAIVYNSILHDGVMFIYKLYCCFYSFFILLGYYNGLFTQFRQRFMVSPWVLTVSFNHGNILQ